MIDTLRSVLHFRRIELDAATRRLARAASVADLRRHRPAPAAARRVRLHRRRGRGRAHAAQQLRRASPASSSGRGCSGRWRRSTRRRRCSAGRCRSRWCWRRPGSPASPIPQGELAVARAAERADLPYTLSTLATRSIEEVAAVSGGRKWFQVYAWRDRGLVKEMVDRCRECGYEALVLTVDTAVLGRRERDVRRGFELPPKIGLGTLLDGAVHPGWTWAFARSEPIVFANVAGAAATCRATAPTPCRCRRTSTRSSTPTCRGTTSTGSGRCGTARSCSRASSRSTTPCWPPSAASTPSPCPTTAAASSTRRRRPIDLVGPVADAVGGRTEIICDGGVRRGSDIVKAVALGATACMAGRAYLYGLGAAGERGVDHVLAMLDDRRPPHDGPRRRRHHRRPHPRPRLTLLAPAERGEDSGEAFASPRGRSMHPGGV